jgi:broad specificity phosphatase PhoE
MKNRTVSWILLSIGLQACAYPALAQKAVLVVRHAEKISDADERLTEAGRARAERLAKMLKDAGVTAIYATDTERSRDTGAGMRGPVDAQPFVATLRNEHAKDVVLVVGHTNTIPDLLKALGCPGDFKIAPNEYDNLFVVVPRSGGPTTLMRLRY